MHIVFLIRAVAAPRCLQNITAWTYSRYVYGKWHGCEDCRNASGSEFSVKLPLQVPYRIGSCHLNPHSDHVSRMPGIAAGKQSESFGVDPLNDVQCLRRGL
jgi:hypothetical protein